MTGPVGVDRLEAQGITVAYREAVVLAGVDLTIPSGLVTAIVGANGSGKSTLLRALARLLEPTAGSICLDGVSIATLPTGEVARRLGILPQGPVAPDDLTVRDLVRRGRHPHLRWYERWRRADEQAVDAALRATGLAALAERSLGTLSGGQRQKAWIAMALAQETRILLLDEPTTYLDIAHQLDLLDLVSELNQMERRTVVMVMHDLNQAARYAQHLVAVREGRVVAEGPPEQVVTVEMVRTTFGVESRILADPVSGAPLVVPIGRVVGQTAAASRAR